MNSLVTNTESNFNRCTYYLHNLIETYKHKNKIPTQKSAIKSNVPESLNKKEKTENDEFTIPE